MLFPGQIIYTTSLPPSVTLHANLETDVWSVPPSTHLFSAPFACVRISASSFRSIEATVSAKFERNTQQGGLLIVLARPGTKLGDIGQRWVTATLEYEHDRMNISVVSCPQFADWSLQDWDGNSATFKMERRANKDGSLGSRLIVSAMRPDGSWRIIREVTWAFAEEMEDIWVGVLANQAYGENVEGNRDGPEVKFDGIKLSTSE